MTGGNAPLGRRDNGLYTTDYAVVADVDPRIGEHLLGVLGDRGIAAYLKPTSDEHPVTRSALLPSPPLDRLYVDRSALLIAVALLEEATSGAMDSSDAVGATAVDPAATPEPESAPSTVTAPATRESDEFEAAWASIIAGYDATAAPDRDWPRFDDGTAASALPADPATSSSPSTSPDETDKPERPRVIKPAVPYLNDDRGSFLDGLDSFGADLPDDEEEDYKPPAPPPLPRITPATTAGVIAVVVGMVAIFAPGLLAALPPTDAQVFGGLCVLAGAVVLISRLRSGDDDDDDDPDDGAVV